MNGKESHQRDRPSKREGKENQTKILELESILLKWNGPNSSRWWQRRLGRAEDAAKETMDPKDEVPEQNDKSVGIYRIILKHLCNWAPERKKKSAEQINFPIRAKVIMPQIHKGCQHQADKYRQARRDSRSDCRKRMTETCLTVPWLTAGSWQPCGSHIRVQPGTRPARDLSPPPTLLLKPHQAARTAQLPAGHCISPSRTPRLSPPAPHTQVRNRSKAEGEERLNAF